MRSLLGVKTRLHLPATIHPLETRRLLAAVGPDGFGYEANDYPFEAVDLVAGAAGVVTLVDFEDDASGSIPLGTNQVNFYGTAYTGSGQVHVSTNGLITFGTPNLDYENGDLTTTPAQRAIAVLWDDWTTNNFGSNSAVLYKFHDTNGDTTPDRLIIEWNDAGHINGGGEGTFQAIITLNTGSTASPIVLNYVDLEVGGFNYDDGADATVGIKDLGVQGANRLLISQNGTSALVASNQAIRITRGSAAPGSIAGTSYNDANGNGVQDGADGGLTGVTVYVDANNSGTFNAGEPSTTTGSGGTYSFSGLSSGTYVIRAVSPAGRRQTFPSAGAGHTVQLASGQNVTGKAFGFTTLAQVAGIVFNDLNGDGAKQAGEPGLSGWRLYLDNNNNSVWDSASEPSLLSGAGGAFSVNLPAGTYRGRIVVQAGWQQTAPLGGAFAGTLASGQKVAGANFGVRQASVAEPDSADAPLARPASRERSLWSDLEILG